MANRSLDIERPGDLEAYLREAGHVAADESIRVTPLAGGVSNRTVLVERTGKPAWVVKQALPRLRVQTEWLSDPARIEREALGIQWLSRLVPGRVPALVFVDPRHFLLAMHAVPQPHDNWKSLLLSGRIEADHVRQFGALLGTIHRSAGRELAHLPNDFLDRSYFESLRLEPYYAYAAREVPEAAAHLGRLIEETRSRRDTLVHGDYSPKNILVHNGQLVLLDHEVIHIGDAAFDLGFSLTHLLSKAHHLPEHRKKLITMAHLYWEMYRATVGQTSWTDNLDARAVQHTLACLLARVAGRSPLEYLNAAERNSQKAVVIKLWNDMPTDVDVLIDRLSAEFAC